MGSVVKGVDQGILKPFCKAKHSHASRGHEFSVGLKLCLLSFGFFETGLFSVALVVLELASVDLAGLQLTCLCLLRAGIQGVHHHRPV